MSRETHTVRRAIIMAAGIGQRMRPLTLATPKPLIRVNGRRMIDTVTDALLANGISEIHVVTGHLKEQFAAWAAERPEVHLIENPWYAESNNISSLYAAREFLGDCMILDGDQVIHNPSVLDPCFERSGYNAVWTEEQTDEWLLDVSGGIIRSCSRTGGARGWRLYSISRWTEEDGKRLRKHLETEFERGNRQIYWDDVAMFCYPEAYRLGIREMKQEDVTEIDSLEELKAVDPGYSEGGT